MVNVLGVYVLTNRLRQTHARGGHWYETIKFTYLLIRAEFHGCRPAAAQRVLPVVQDGSASGCKSEGTLHEDDCFSIFK